MSLATGTRLGPYEVLAPLGAGGMGEVYKASDTRLDRMVAIKVLPERLAGDAHALARFEREAKAVAALSHPNILAIFDVGTDRGVSYVVTELLEGETLRARLVQGALPWRKAAGIGAALAEGLTAAHAKGIIHRDLKPENIFITTDGRAKILDFGVALMRTPGTADDETVLRVVTEPGSLTGTVGYLSPEQIQGAVATATSDLFSLGCVLYEMAAGRAPFRRSSTAETIAAIVSQDPPPIGRADDAPEFEQVTLRCLEKDPRARFASARDLAARLADILSSQDTGRTPGQIPRARPIDSLAVLPFTNAGGDPDAEYFSEGITESIINNLSQLGKLRVAARSTVFRYKGQDDLSRVASELNVRAVLTGRVVQRGDSLRIQAELVNAADLSQIWGQRYSRKVADIFAIEEEIAKEISDALRLRLTTDEQKQLEKRHTADDEAYQLYLKARYYWNRRSADTLKQAVACFEQAVARDPRYAIAWSGMADCYTLYGTYYTQSPREALPKAEEAARKALEIDPGLGDAHACLGVARAHHDFDWAGAEQEIRRAVALNPSSATAHNWFTMVLLPQGRAEEGVEHSRRSVELEPLSLGSHMSLSLSLTAAGRYDEALEIQRRALELHPQFEMGRRELAFTFARKGMLPEAVAELESALALGGRNPILLGALGYVAGLSGRFDEARAILSELAELRTSRYVSPFDLALTHLGLGETGQALDWLERACEDRSFWFLYSIRLPFFASVRSEPRFREILRRMNLSA